MITRRNFVKIGALTAGGAALGPNWLMAAQGAFAATAQTPLPGSSIPQFVDPLPDLDVLDGATSQQLQLEMREFLADVMPSTFLPGTYKGTYVWGYLKPGQTTRASYLGPVILAKRGTPTEIKFVNNLGNTATSKVVAYTQSTDQTLHWADPLNGGANKCAMSMQMVPTGICAQNYAGPIPAAVHLHGGEVPSEIDGGPDAWFTSDGKYVGQGYYSKDGSAPKNYVIYRYPNSQEAAPIWYHDHTLGATRLNVYAGLAGGYLITDPANDPANLPPLLPLVIQDRMFDTNGQLFFPAGVPYVPNPDHPFWVPEFLGDTIVVNGKAWPFKAVAPKRYTCLFLNGSNARTYELSLVNQATGAAGPAMWVIGNDGGYLDAPVAINKLVIMPGERYQVIIDFSGFAGQTLLVRNTAKAPYPAGAAPKGNTTGRVLQFRVSAGSVTDTYFNPATGAALRSKKIVRLVNPATGTLAVATQKKRQLTLNEVMGMPMTVNGVVYPGGPLEILVNNTKWMAATTEVAQEGDTEIWEIVNLTADAHPMHTHLTQFQLMNRQNFDVKGYQAAYGAAFTGGGKDPMTNQPYPAGVYIPAFGPPKAYNTPNADGAVGGNPAVAPFLQGKIQPPNPQETGWKDTVLAPPGMITRFVVRFAPTDTPANTAPRVAGFPFNPSGGDGYVWHCHIIDHEDNEMMRPSKVEANNITRTYVKGPNY